jgi:hypothetical protein
MTPTLSRRSPRGRLRLILFGLCVVGAFALTGCGQPDEIAAYDTPKPDIKESAGKNRLLAAVFLHEDTAWHIKLVGPVPEMKDHEAAFRDFLKTIRFNKEGKPTWTVLEEWKRLPNRSSRFAAFQIGTGTKALELTVVPLPAANGDLNILQNVNRWRRLLHRQPIDEPALEQFQSTLVIDGKKIPLFDLSGSGSGKTPRDPDEPEVIEVTPSKLKSYDSPSGWVKTDRQDPNAAKVGVRREAAFDVIEGNLRAEVTVIPLPNTGPGAVRPNLDRWAEQVGLPRLTDEQAQKLVTPLTVDGIEQCFQIDLVGPTGATRQEILAAIVVLGDKIWTFKMSGPAELVTRQKETFVKFVKSAKFEGGR